LTDIFEWTKLSLAMDKINIHQAKTHLSRLVERAAGGEEIIIAKSGKPVARLLPYISKNEPPLIAEGLPPIFV